MTKSPSLPLNALSIGQRVKNAGLRRERVIREITINQMHHRLAQGSIEWMVKGGEAMVARGVSSRATRDLDVRVPGPDLQLTVAGFREAIALELGDGLTYEATPVRAALSEANTGGYPGLTVRVRVALGVRSFDEFRVDLVAGREPTGTPRRASSPLTLPLPELTAATVLLFPTVDHIADKLCATHATYGRAEVASSRVKDIYDLRALRGAEAIEAEEVYEAIVTESLARKLPVPGVVAVPPAMKVPFEALVRREVANPLVPERFDDAVAAVAGFLDPVLASDVVNGAWHPHDLRWVARSGSKS